MIEQDVLETKEAKKVNLNAVPSVKEPLIIKLNGEILNVFVVRVTSTMAKKIVEGTNVKNRILSHKNIRHIQHEMEVGNWLFEGNPLKFDLDGRLLDGQHRLIALSKTKKLAFDFLVVSGLKNETFKVMDTGKKRSAGDVFSIEGVHYPKIAATTVKFIHALENGSFLLGETVMNSGLSNTEAYEKYLMLDDVDDFVTRTRLLNTGYPKLLSDATVAGFWYMFSQVNKEDADEFMVKLIQGTNLDIDSPIKVVHDKLFSLAHTTAYKMKRIDKNRIVGLAWKKFRAGEKMTKLIIPKKSDDLKIVE